MQLYVITRQDEVVPLKVNPNDHISYIQQLVLQRQCLQFNSMELEPHRTIASYGIQSESILHLTGRRQRYFHLYIRTYSGLTFTVRTSRSDTLANIKYQIRDKEPTYHYDKQVLFHNGRLLQGDERSLGSFNILDDALMDLGMMAPPPASTTTVGTTTAAPIPIPYQKRQPTSTSTATKANHRATVPTSATKAAPAVVTPSPKAKPAATAPIHQVQPATTPTSATAPIHKVQPATTPTSILAKMAATIAAASLQKTQPATSPTVLSTTKPSTTSSSSNGSNNITTQPQSSKKRKVATQPVDILVKVKCHTRIFDIAISTLDKVLSMKTKITKYTNVAAAAQSLTYNGQRLNDNDFIGDYNIGHGSLIDMLTRPQPRSSATRKPNTTIPSTSTIPSSSSSDLLPVKKESVYKPSNALFRWKTGQNAIIELLSSDEDEDEKDQEPQQPQQERKRHVKLRVEDGTIYTIEMAYSPDSKLLDVIRQYQTMVGQQNKQVSQKSIVFGGVALENEFLLDDLFLDEESILNLV